MKDIVLPPFEALIHPATKHVIDPIADVIPQPFRDFVDVKQDFEDLYHGILEGVFQKVLGAGGAIFVPKPTADGASVSAPVAVAEPTVKVEVGAKISGQEPAKVEVEVEVSVPAVVEDSSLSVSTEVRRSVDSVFNTIADSLTTSDKHEAFEGRHFLLVSELSDLVLEIEGASEHAGAKIVTHNYHGGRNQQFKFDERGYIVSAISGKVLDIDGATQPGSPIVQSEARDADTQKWKLHHDGTIRLDTVDLCLHIEGSSKEPGSPVVAWPVNGGANQKWRVANIWH